jgi:Mpv17 / PMP22 family
VVTEGRCVALTERLSYNSHIAMHGKMKNRAVILLVYFVILISFTNGFTNQRIARNSQIFVALRSATNLPSEPAESHQQNRSNKRLAWRFVGGKMSQLLQPLDASPKVLAPPKLNSILPVPWQFVIVATLLLFKSIGRQIFQFLAQISAQSMSWYILQLEVAPLITKSVTSGVLGMGGDYMAQWLEYKLGKRISNKQSSSWKDVVRIHQTYHLRRGLAILVDGLIISGPLMHWGYNFFEYVLPISGAQHRWVAALAHVVADSVFLDAIFVGTAFIVTGLMEGYRLRRDIWPQFRTDYGPTLRASWATSLILMPLEFVCFRFLPVSFRTLAMNLTDIIWDTVVSFMAHRSRLAADRQQWTHHNLENAPLCSGSEEDATFEAVTFVECGSTNQSHM